MLGRFLEFSFAAQPLAGAFEFYRSLGFQPIAVGDQLSDPYVALFDGSVAIGLHDREQSGPRLTFVRPQLRDYVRAMRRIGIELERAHLADDEFNHVAFSDPNGQAIALLEARTFTASDWNRQSVHACGAFLEYSIATDSIERSRTFWEALGFARVAEGEAPHRWLRLAGRGLVLGLHEAGFRPGLSFRSEHLAPRLEYLQAKGCSVRAGAPLASSSSTGATLNGPDGATIYLVETET